MEMKKLKHLLIQPNDIEGKIALAEQEWIVLCANGCEKCFLKCENKKKVGEPFCLYVLQ